MILFTRKRISLLDYNGGEDATRTHNALRHTTFPMWLLTIRIPLHMASNPLPGWRLCYYSETYYKNQVHFLISGKIFLFVSVLWEQMV